MARHTTTSATVAALLAIGHVAAAQTPAADRAEEIVVISSLVPQPRRQIGTGVSVIDSAEIELRGYPELADVLRTQTGIGVSNSGGAGKPTALRIRGEEHYRTLLVIDGVKALDPSAPQVAPSFESLLTTSDLERIEVLRGPQGFIYGADAGGVVNVLTRRGGDELEGRLGLEYGDYETHKLDAAVSGGGEGGDYFVSVADFATDGFNARTADTTLQDDDGADNATFHAKLGWNVADDVRLQLVARDIDAETGFDDCFSTLTFTLGHDCRGTTEQTTYRASADVGSGAFASSIGFSDVETLRENFAAGRSEFSTDGEIARFEYTGHYKPSDALGLVFGLDFQDEELADGTTSHSRDQKGYYFEYQGAFDDALFISLGARYDDNDDFGAHTSARVSAAYVQRVGADRSLKYRASYGTGFRAPSLYEIAYNSTFAFPPAAGFPLTEENSDGYDIGIEYAAPSGLALEVTYFDQRIEDEIYFDLVTFSGYLQSTGESSSDGVEIAVEAPLGRRWQLVFNWTHNETADVSGAQRLRRPENMGNLGLLYRGADDRLGLIASYRLARDAVDIGGTSLDDYEVLDLSLSFRLNGALELHGRLENATDERYEELRGYNTAGRSLYAGVRLRL